MADYRLLLIGFGNAGQALARFLTDTDRLSHFKLPAIKVVGIVTGSGGSVVNNDGVDLQRALYEKATTGRFSPKNPGWTKMSGVEIINTVPADIMIEVSSLDIISGQPAINHIKAAFKNKMHVVTLNKGPLAFAYDDLKKMSLAHHLQFLFEGTVMDGAPVFNLVRENLKGCRVTGFRGILNSTTNYILGEMEQGLTLESAVRKAQKFGFVESDPSFDVLGWDSAFKTAILLNVLMGVRCVPQEIERRGIDLIKASEIRSALKEKKRLKLICEGFFKGGKAEGRVYPLEISGDDLMHNINGSSSILMLQTDSMGDVTIVEHYPDLKQTLYAIISDLMQIFNER